MKLDKNTIILLALGGLALLFFLSKRSAAPVAPRLPAARPTNPIASLISTGLDFIATATAAKTPSPGGSNPSIDEGLL